MYFALAGLACPMCFATEAKAVEGAGQWPEACQLIAQEYASRPSKTPPGFDSLGVADSHAADPGVTLTVLGAVLPAFDHETSFRSGQFEEEDISLHAVAPLGVTLFINRTKISLVNVPAANPVAASLSDESNSLGGVSEVSPRVAKFNPYDIARRSLSARPEDLKCSADSVAADLLTIKALSTHGFDSDQGVFARDSIATPGYRGYAYAELIEASEDSVTRERYEIVLFNDQVMYAVSYSFPRTAHHIRKRLISAVLEIVER